MDAGVGFYFPARVLPGGAALTIEKALQEDRRRTLRIRQTRYPGHDGKFTKTTLSHNTWPQLTSISASPGVIHPPRSDTETMSSRNPFRRRSRLR